MIDLAMVKSSNNIYRLTCIFVAAVAKISFGGVQYMRN